MHPTNYSMSYTIQREPQKIECNKYGTSIGEERRCRIRDHVKLHEGFELTKMGMHESVMINRGGITPHNTLKFTILCEQITKGMCKEKKGACTDRKAARTDRKAACRLGMNKCSQHSRSVKTPKSLLKMHRT